MCRIVSNFCFIIILKIMAVNNIFKQSNMEVGNYSVKYLIYLLNMFIFEIGIPLLEFRLCEENNIF